MCVIEQRFVGIVRVGRKRSDFIAGAVSNGLFVQRMFLNPLVLMNRRYMGHWGAVEAVGGHGDVEVCRVDAEAQLREEVGEDGIKGKNNINNNEGEVGKSGAHITAIYILSRLVPFPSYNDFKVLRCVIVIEKVGVLSQKMSPLDTVLRLRTLMIQYLRGSSQRSSLLGHLLLRTP